MTRLKEWLKKIKLTYWLAGVIIVLFVLAIGLYVFSPLGKWGYRVFQYLPFPVAVVDGKQIITTRQLIKDTQALKTFYVSQEFAEAGMRVDFSTDEGKMRLKVKEKDILDKLVENKIVEKLAKERNIQVTENEAEREINKQISETGDRQSLQLNLQKLYGWDVDDFRDKVVVNQLYLQKLSAYYYKNQKQDQPGYDKIMQAKKELKSDGSNFAQVAEKYSEGDSAKNGGELGWFTYDQLVPEVAKTVFESKEGTLTDVIQSTLGYHIVVVEEFRQANENSTSNNNVLENQSSKNKQVKIKQIFVNNGGFLDWLSQEKKKVPVSVWMKDYQWDANEAMIKFRDDSLNKAEQTLRAKSEGDPSMQ